MPLHPQAQALLQSMEGAPSIPEGTVDQARQLSGMLRQLVGEGPEVGRTRTVSVPVASDLSIEALVLDPPQSPPVGLIVYFHGGGFVVGSPRDFEAMYRKLVVSSGCRLISADYRLAPEYPFPAGVNDAYATLVWAAKELADGLPVAVAGDSSGANFAAVAARRARDYGGPDLALQVLVYPVADHDFSRASYRQHGHSGLLVGRADMEWYWNHYAADAGQRDDPDASPLRAASMAGLPPAYVLIDEFDPLRDEGRAYAGRLEADGVPVIVDYVDDQLHGFFTLVNMMDSADSAVERVGAAIRARCVR